MTDKLDASLLEETPLLTELPENGVFLMRVGPTGDFGGLPRQLLPSGGGTEPIGPLTILDGGWIGQAADRIFDAGMVGETADAVLDGGLIGETGAGITHQQFRRGVADAWVPTARLRQGEPGVVFDPLTGDVLGIRIGKAVIGDLLATTPVSDNSLLTFFSEAGQEKLANIEPLATAAGEAGDEHAAITGNPHATGIGDIVGMQDALDARAPLAHTHSPADVGLGQVTNDRQLKEDLTSYDEKTAPAAGDFVPLQDGVSGQMRRFDWSLLPSGGTGSGPGPGSNPAITFVTTTAELLDALAADKKIIYLAAATFNFNTPLLLDGTQLIGAGRGRTTLNWTGGASAAISSRTPTTRTYNSGLYGFTLTDGGSGTIGVNWASISIGYLQNLHVSGFDTQYALGGPNGYCVYNRLYDCTAQGGTTGFLIGPTGANANSLIACRGNAVGGWCVDIAASNGNLVQGCQFESSIAGVRVRSDSVADGDGTIVCFNRFEAINGGSGGIAIQVAGANTRTAQIFFNHILSTGGAISDAGTRTIIMSMGDGSGAVMNLATPYANPGGAYRLTRTAASTDVPMLVLSDTAAGSGAPVTLEINTERAAGTYLRGRRGGVTYTQLTADGKGLFAAGIGVGNSAAAASMGALTRKVEVFDASGASLGFVPIYAS